MKLESSWIGLSNETCKPQDNDFLATAFDVSRE